MNKSKQTAISLVSRLCGYLFKTFFRGEPSRDHLRRLAHWLPWAGLAELTLPLQQPESPAARDQQRLEWEALKKGLLASEAAVFENNPETGSFIECAKRILAARSASPELAAMEVRSAWNLQPGGAQKFPPQAIDGMRRMLSAISIQDPADHALFFDLCSIRGAMVFVTICGKTRTLAAAIVRGQEVHPLAKALKARKADGTAILPMLITAPGRHIFPDYKEVAMAACKQLFFTGAPTREELDRLSDFVTWIGYERCTLAEPGARQIVGEIQTMASTRLRELSETRSSTRTKRNLTPSEWIPLIQGVAVGHSVLLCGNECCRQSECEIVRKKPRNQIRAALIEKLKGSSLTEDWQIETLLAVVAIAGAMRALSFPAARITNVLDGKTVHALTYAEN